MNIKICMKHNKLKMGYYNLINVENLRLLCNKAKKNKILISNIEPFNNRNGCLI